MIKLFALLFIFIVAMQNALAIVDSIEEKYISAEIYSSKNGLPNNTITKISQDDNGFLWIATGNGLSRFDSTEFQNFSKDRTDEYSLPGIYIEDLLLMPNDELWLSIHKIGMVIFDKLQQKFTSIKNQKSNLFQMPNSNLYGMEKDKHGNVWFSLYGEGIYQWSADKNKFYKHLQSDVNAWLTTKKTYEILIDSQNRLWVCTIDSKVFVYDIKSGKSQSFNFSTDINDPLSSPVYGFTESNTGDIYAGSYSGLFKFNEKTQLFELIIDSSLLSEYHNGEQTSVYHLLVDSQDNIWIGTNKSMFLYSHNTLNALNFYKDGELLSSQWRTHAIIEDYNGNIWIGTEGFGLIKLSPERDRYNIYLLPKKENSFAIKAYQFDNKFWMADQKAKISQFKYIDNQIRAIKTLPQDLNADLSRVDSLLQVKHDSLWVSSARGIYRVNTTDGKITNVVNHKGEKLGSVNTLYLAKDNNFYFSLLSERVIGYFNKTEMKAHYVDGHYIGSLVSKVSMGLDEKLWLATSHGIETLDITQHKYGIAFEDSSIQNISDFSIDKENNSVLMIAEGGLYHLKWNGSQLVMPEDKYRYILPKINFLKITHYKNDIYLITTEGSGIVEFNIKTSQYKIYTTDNGLPSNVIVDVLMVQDTPVIVTKTGIATFNNQPEKRLQEKPKILIDNLKLNNQKLSLSDENILVLEYNYGSLKFDIALLAFNNSSSIEYEYVLEGHNDSWATNGSDDKYSFNNLQSGNYTFKIRGRSNYSLWSDTVEYSFIVNPPIWKTWWAYILYLLVLLMIILWVSYLYRRKLLYEHEIANQQTKKELAKATSKAKSEFLAKVSHEVRTPLNGVLGMSELMLDTKLDNEQKIYTDSIITSGNHLLDIINDILDLSKIEAGKLDLELRSIDLLLLIDEVVESFTSLAIQKKLLFTHCFDHHVNRYRVGDTIRIKQILFNLLSNAFKFTNKGEITLEVKNVTNDPHSITISVKDTGIGINNKKIEQLFKPFVQADSTVTRKFGGTGLGLAIVKQLTEKMNGNVTASNQNNKGSTFSVKLKLNIDKDPQNTTNKYNGTICLLINQNNLKQSLIEYSELAGVKYSSSIGTNTKYVFFDTFSAIDKQQEIQLQQAIKLDIPLIFIGFEFNQFQQKYKQQATLINPPFSFNNFESLCSYNDDKLFNSRKTNPQTPKIDTLKILLIEDNPINQQVCFKMLRKKHHIIDIADDAKAGFELLKTNQYDLLIVDYHLPGMDGLSLIKKWDNPEHIPIIVLTADLTDSLYSKCQKLNITNIVSKPFTQNSLFAAIDKIMS